MTRLIEELAEKRAASAPVTVGFVHLGCAKTLIDSEKILGNLAGAGGFLVGADPDACDIVIVNTCGFLEASRQESLGAIREVLARKAEGTVRKVVVAGCMAQKDRGLIEREVPGIDAVIGVADRESIAGLCRELTGLPADGTGALAPAPAAVAATTGSAAPVLFRIGSNERPPDPDDGRLRLTPRHYAYLRTSEGCDHPCTFCSIPGIRGKNKSKPLEHIVREAQELAADGARELVIVGQDTADYGRDLYGKRRLHDLLAALAGVPGVEWIRALYIHPVNLDEALVDALTSIPQVVTYADMPVQHGADRVLKRMLRRTTAAYLKDCVQKLRERASRRFFVRSTIIAGFPGETEADFEELLQFLAEVRFDRLGCFAYSFEESTPSARLDGQLPLVERQRRRDRVMEVQQEIGFAVARSLVGTSIEAIVDRTSGGEGILEPQTGAAVALGRTYGDCPEDDPVIAIRSPGRALQAGEIVTVHVDESRGYDLVGTVQKVLHPA